MYLFLLGRNKILSKVELLNILTNLEINYALIDTGNDYITLDLDLPDNFIDLLGGTLKVMKFIGDFDFSVEFFEQLELYVEEVNYSIKYENSSTESSGFETLLKSYLKKERIKAIKKNANLKKPSEYFKFKLNEGIELYVRGEGKRLKVYQTVQSTNPQKYKDLDEGRPDRSFIHGTAPRTAQILTNLLNFKDISKIADPFCGTGTFLNQFILSGFDAVGIDSDNALVKQAKKNVHWAKMTYHSNNAFKIILGDSKLEEFEADASVFEPYMGPFLERLPDNSKSRRIVIELGDLYDAVFENLAKAMKSSSNPQVVCILPEFISASGELFQVSESVFGGNGFTKRELVFHDKSGNTQRFANPIPYVSAKGSIIRRKVYMLEMQ